VVAMIGSVPAGALADSIGARQVYVLSTVLSGAGALFLALTDSYWVMLLVELVFGFPRTTGWVASQTYISFVGRPEERTRIAGLFSFSTSIGSLTAPLLGGLSAQLIGYQASFWVLVPIAAAYTATGLALPDLRAALTPPKIARVLLAGPGGAGPSGASGRRILPAGAARGGPVIASSSHGLAGLAGYRPALGLLHQRGIQLAMVLTFVRIWILVGWFTFFRVFLAQQGFPPLLIGSVEAASNLVSMASSLGASVASRIASKEAVTAGSLAITGLGTLVSPPLAFFPLVYLPGVLVGFGNGLTLPLLLAIIADAAPPEQRGLAFGLRTGANRTASTAAPALLGLVMTPLSIPTGLALSAAGAWLALVGHPAA